MIHALALMKFKTHTVHISRSDQDQIVVFKYNDYKCEWDMFDSHDEASDYIVTELSEWVWEVAVDECD